MTTGNNLFKLINTKPAILEKDIDLDNSFPVHRALCLNRRVFEVRWWDELFVEMWKLWSWGIFPRHRGNVSLPWSCKRSNVATSVWWWVLAHVPSQQHTNLCLWTHKEGNKYSPISCSQIQYRQMESWLFSTPKLPCLWKGYGNISCLEAVS